MRGRTDIAGISLAYTAGVAFSHVSGARWLPLVMAGIAVLSFIILKRKGAALAVLFFAVGAYIAAVRGRIGEMDTLARIRVFAASRADGLRVFISSIPWGHEGTAPLLTALLTGSRKGLCPETTEAFRQSGASHILALSGLHLGVIYGIIRTVFKPLGKSPQMGMTRAGINIGLCSFYTLMTGAGPSLVRALLFIIIRELTLLSPERKTDIARTLFLSLMIQLTLSPEVITQVGFQLSYLAMAGIALIHPLISSWYPEGPGPIKKVWDSLSLSISCQLTTAPLVWIRFRTFPQMFLLTNFLALPICGILIPTALVSMAAYALSPQLGAPLTVATDFLAEGMQWMMRIIGRLSLL